MSSCDDEQPRKKARCAIFDELSMAPDDSLKKVRHREKMAEWEAVQPRVSEAMKVPLAGMISEVDAAASFRAHVDQLEAQGYAFGSYPTGDRSLSEKLKHSLFDATPASWMGFEVLGQAMNILKQVNAKSKPSEEDEDEDVSLWVMFRTQYVSPLVDLVHLLVHPKATLEDLHLFWELTDRLWCVAHPIYPLHSGWLDETCCSITRRLAEVSREEEEAVVDTPRA